MCTSSVCVCSLVPSFLSCTCGRNEVMCVFVLYLYFPTQFHMSSLPELFQDCNVSRPIGLEQPWQTIDYHVLFYWKCINHCKGPLTTPVTQLVSYFHFHLKLQLLVFRFPSCCISPFHQSVAPLPFTKLLHPSLSPICCIPPFHQSVAPLPFTNLLHPSLSPICCISPFLQIDEYLADKSELRKQVEEDTKNHVWYMGKE